jgi:hypothetical protein
LITHVALRIECIQENRCAACSALVLPLKQLDPAMWPTCVTALAAALPEVDRCVLIRTRHRGARKSILGTSAASGFKGLLAGLSVSLTLIFG